MMIRDYSTSLRDVKKTMEHRGTMYSKRDGSQGVFESQQVALSGVIIFFMWENCDFFFSYGGADHIDGVVLDKKLYFESRQPPIQQ